MRFSLPVHCASSGDVILGKFFLSWTRMLPRRSSFPLPHIALLVTGPLPNPVRPRHRSLSNVNLLPLLRLRLLPKRCFLPSPKTWFKISSQYEETAPSWSEGRMWGTQGGLNLRETGSCGGYHCGDCWKILFGTLLSSWTYWHSLTLPRENQAFYCCLCCFLVSNIDSWYHQPSTQGWPSEEESSSCLFSPSSPLQIAPSGFLIQRIVGQLYLWRIWGGDLNSDEETDKELLDPPVTLTSTPTTKVHGYDGKASGAAYCNKLSLSRHFPHKIRTSPEVNKGLVAPVRRFLDMTSGIKNGIWPGTQYILLLQRFINLHFSGSNDLYWGFGTWASQAYFHTLDTVLSVLQWNFFHTK